MNLKYSIAFKKYADSHSMRGHQLASLGSLSQYEQIYDFVSTLPKSAKILDWGCGNGHFSAYLKSLGYQPISFSFDTPTFIDKSTHVLGKISDPTALPFQSESFDYVFSIGVLEHVHETGGTQETSINEIHRVLKSGGKFVIYHFPNEASWIEMLANLLKKVGMHSHYTHTKKFTREDIKYLFQEWNLLCLTRYGTFPRNIFNRLPRILSNNKHFILMYDFLDKILKCIISPFTQNYFILVEKKK